MFVKLTGEDEVEIENMLLNIQAFLENIGIDGTAKLTFYVDGCVNAEMAYNNEKAKLIMQIANDGMKVIKEYKDGSR